MSDCLQILEDTGNIVRCCYLYPEFRPEILEFAVRLGLISESEALEAQTLRNFTSRQEVLAAARSEETRGQGILRSSLVSLTVVLLMFGGAAAGATSDDLTGLGPVSEVLSAVGLVDVTDSSHYANDRDSQRANSATAVPAVDVPLQEASNASPGSTQSFTVGESTREPALEADRPPETASDALGNGMLGQTSWDCEQPGRSPEAPGQSDKQPDQTSKVPANCGEQPGKSSEAPGQSGEQPGKSSEAPGQNGEQPGKSSEAPGQSGEQPGKSSEAPGQSGERPGKSSGTPGQSKKNPN